MEFTLSREQQMARSMFREFAEREVEPLAAQVDKEEMFPEVTIKKMAKLGMMGIYFPKEYGGAGADVLTYAMCIEELAKKCATTGVILSVHTGACTNPVFEFGTPEQKAKYLPKLCSGEWLGAFALTEPGAGTDAQGQTTTAVDAGDHWVLNGNKIFITNAGYANLFVVAAVTGEIVKNGRKRKEISAFLVERDFPGFTVGKPEDKMGIRGSSTCELVFQDCIVPKENLLGKLGQGFKIAMSTLDGGRIGIASQALGIAQGALDVTIQYVKERRQFGRTLSEFQNTQFELAEMKTRIDAARLLVYQAATKKQAVLDGSSKEPYGVYASEAKLFASRTASNVTRRCLQLFGGYGYTRDYPIERMMRDAKITEIYEGTSEAQMMVISNSMLR